MRNTKTLGSRLNCEMLESRDTPAGNVVAVVTPLNEVFIGGDGLDNGVNLQYDLSGNLVLSGIGGTLVNGFDFVVLGNGIPTSVRFDMGGGNDRVEVVGVSTFGTLLVNGESGDDTVAVVGAAAAEIAIFGQTGNDTLIVSQAQANLIGIDGSTGNDAIRLENALTFVGVQVTGGTENDFAALAGVSTFGWVALDGGSGDDLLGLAGVAANTITVTGDAGNDNTNLTFVQANQIVLDGGLGVNALHFDNTIAFFGLFPFNQQIIY